MIVLPPPAWWAVGITVAVVLLSFPAQRIMTPRPIRTERDARQAIAVVAGLVLLQLLTIVIDYLLLRPVGMGAFAVALLVAWLLIFAASATYVLVARRKKRPTGRNLM